VPTAIDSDWLEARITRAKALIVAYEDAIESLTVGGAQSYTLDTGQTRTVVTRAQLGSLESGLARAENRLAALEARCRGGGVIGRPGF